MTSKDADVIVVGAGPAGSAAAHYLASNGMDVLLLEKSAFPRDKVCGDGLTPRAVKELVSMGVPTPKSDGWVRNWGLRVIGGGYRLELPWPELTAYPNYGLTKPRGEFDHILAQHAVNSGARLQQNTTVNSPVVDERSGRVIGVNATIRAADGSKEKARYHAPLVVAADGASARLALALGIEKNPNRPMGVAVRTYFKADRDDDSMMESHLELWDGKPGESNLLPGYGWIFALGDGTVNVGLGSVSSSAKATKIDYRDMFRRWIEATPPEWGFNDDTQVGKIGSGPLPMAFNRKPHYSRGLLLVGDSGGMISPFNGEGIGYALLAGRVVGEVCAQAAARTNPVARERVLQSYGKIMEDQLGGYFSLGRVFVRLIEHPQVMHICTKYGLPRPVLMRFTMKLLADLYEPSGGDVFDRVIAGLSRVVPAA